MWLRSGQEEVSNNCFQTCGFETWQKVVANVMQKHCHHLNNVRQIFLAKKKMSFSFLFCFCFALLKNGRRSVTSLPPTKFLHTTQNAIRAPLYHRMWSPLCNLFSGTLLHEPCSHKFVLKHNLYLLRISVEQDTVLGRST